jgi:hypothetical protein
MRSLLLLVLVTLASACGRSGAYCVGNELHDCALTCDEYLCSNYCIDTGSDAFCALKAEPSAPCSADRPFADGCLDNKPVSCAYGYIVGEGSPCAGGETCFVTPSLNALCAASTTPNPDCQTMPTVCVDSKHWAECRDGGYIGNVVACDCVVGPIEDPKNVLQTVTGAFCSLSGTRDLACQADSADGYCSNGVEIHCWDGYDVYTEDCVPATCPCQAIASDTGTGYPFGMPPL